MSRAQIASRSQPGATRVFVPTPTTWPQSSSTTVRRSAPRSSTSRCRVAAETFIRPPASVCSSQPGVRVLSSSASRSMVASSKGRGAGGVGVRGAGAAGEGVLAQAQQPVGHRPTVLAGHGTPARVELVERVLDRVTVGQVIGHGDGWAQRGVECLGQGREPDGVVLAVQRPAPEQVRLQLQEPVTLGRLLGPLQPGRLMLVDPVPHVLRRSRRAPSHGGRSSPQRPARSSSPRRPTGTRRAARQIAATCDHDSHRSASPASVAGMSASISTAPRMSRGLGVGAADLVLQPHVQRHARR